MRAVVVSDERSLEIVNLPELESPRPGWVVVRVAYCGICGSDLHFLKSPLIPSGTILGHELSGTIEYVGAGVDTPKVGDQVAVLPAQRCEDDQCVYCADGASQRCIKQQSTSIGISIPGGFADLVEVPATSCFVLDSETSLVSSAVIEPLAVALHAVNVSKFEPEMPVGIVGAGPIGLLTVLLLRSLGAGPIGVAEPSAARRDLARALGADSVVAYTPQLFAAMGDAPEVIFECAGTSETPAESVAAVRPGGEVILVGVTDPLERSEISTFLWVIKEVTVKGVIAYTTEEFVSAARLVDHNEIDTSQIVTSVLPLEQANEAFEELRDDARQGKVLLCPDVNC